MATCNAESSNDENHLSEMFDEAFKLFNSLERSSEPVNDSSFQAKIKRCMLQLEEATRLVSAADIFSTNEQIEEIPTEHLRYILLPVLLGELTLKLCSGNRSEIVNVADVYFKDYLKRCSEYGLGNRDCTTIANASNTSQQSQLAAMIGTRNAKLQKFREHKELQSRLKVLQEYVDSEQVDEDTRREYFVTVIKSYIMKSKDELESLALEKQILQHMETISQDDTESRNTQIKKKTYSSKPLTPVIITKDEIQKAVYGAGYPSLPTFTVQEFYDQRVRDGIFPDPTKPKSTNLPKALQEMTEEDVEAEETKAEEDKDKEEEADDPDVIARARAMDEYKDENRRGWGNRYNRS